jgi:murein DD-endopeptidase MepM/ murein hydrolase activator NlpD
MKKLKFTLVIPFLFAVLNSHAQGFNSIRTVQEINSVEIRHPKPIVKDTVVKIKVIRDTIFTSTYLPDKEPLAISRLPINKIILTSGFGIRVHPVLGNIKFHNGIDLSARQADIYSVLHGTVVVSSYDNIIGNYVVVNHGLYESTYGHLSVRFVKVGDLVKAGTVLGISGATGRVTGEHLHFIVKYRGSAINPLPFLKEILSVNKKEELTQLLTQNK